MFNRSFYFLWFLCASLLIHDSYAGGSGRPGKNPFETGSEQDLESLARAKKISVLNVAFTSNVASKLGPCGCSTNPKGGVDRRHNFLQSIKPMFGELLILDAGNAFFANRSLDPSLLSNQQERALKIAKAHKDLGVFAQNVGSLDLAAGLDFVKKIEQTSGLNLISTNLILKSTKKPVFKKFEIFESKDLGKILILGITTKPDSSLMDFDVLDPLEVVNNQIKEHSPNLTIVLSDLGQGPDVGLMSKITKPVLFVGSRDLNSLDIPVHSGEGFLVQPGIQGQQVGLVRIAINKNSLGWRNLTQDKALATRWNQLMGERDYLESLGQSEDRTRLLKKVNESFAEIKKFAKTSLSESWPYTYELYDLDEKYQQKNKFTVLSLEDQ